MNDDFVSNLMWAALLALMGLAMCVAGSWADDHSHGSYPEEQYPATESELPSYYNQPQTK